MLVLAAILTALATASAAPAAPWTVSAGYYGTWLTQPGLFAAAERPLATQGPHHLVLGARLGGFHHVRRHTGLFARAEAGYRLAGRGPYAEAFVGLGVRHTVLAGAVYVSDGEGGVRRTLDAGRPTFAPSLALGAGWRLSEALRLFGRVEGWVRAPVNRMWLPGVAMSVGAAWTPGT